MNTPHEALPITKQECDECKALMIPTTRTCFGEVIECCPNCGELV